MTISTSIPKSSGWPKISITRPAARPPSSGNSSNSTSTIRPSRSAGSETSSGAAPDAREAALKVLDLWLSRGVDGYRLDVANAYLHYAKLTDNPAIPAAERNFLEWTAAANMQLHYFDSNLVENRAEI